MGQDQFSELTRAPWLVLLVALTAITVTLPLGAVGALWKWFEF